jgi:hypothetical protein
MRGRYRNTTWNCFMHLVVRHWQCMSKSVLVLQDTDTPSKVATLLATRRGCSSEWGPSSPNYAWSVPRLGVSTGATGLPKTHKARTGAFSRQRPPPPFPSGSPLIHIHHDLVPSILKSTRNSSRVTDAKGTSSTHSTRCKPTGRT